MKKLTTILTIVGVVLAVAGICAAVFFYLRKRSAGYEEAVEETEPEPEAEAQSA